MYIQEFKMTVDNKDKRNLRFIFLDIKYTKEDNVRTTIKVILKIIILPFLNKHEIINK